MDENIFAEVLEGNYGYSDSVEVEVRKKEVFNWVLGLGIRVDPKVLGLDAEKKTGEEGRNEESERKGRWKEGQEKKYENRRQGKESHEERKQHAYSGKTTVMHHHAEGRGGAKAATKVSKKGGNIVTSTGGGSTISAIRHQKKLYGRNSSLEHSLNSALQNGVFLSYLAAAVMKLKHGDR